jgi:hypothetical protein
MMISAVSDQAGRDVALQDAAFFESLVGADLHVAGATMVERWRVDKVVRHAAHSARDGQPFNVYLSAPPANDRSQGMKNGRTAEGVEVSFFAVPISATTDKVAYEVIFN